MNQQLAGALSGLVATVPMSAVMLAWHKVLPASEQYALPPRIVTERAAEQVGVADHLNDQEKRAATVLAHFGYGAAAGVAYGSIAGSSHLPPAAEGSLYGLAVWGGSYLGLLPSTGLHRSATDEPTGRNSMMIAAHLVWGVSLGLLFAKMRNSR